MSIPIKVMTRPSVVSAVMSAMQTVAKGLQMMRLRDASAMWMPMSKLTLLVTLRRLVKHQDRLLVAYQMGSHPGESTLYGIRKCRERLKEIEDEPYYRSFGHEKENKQE